MKLNIHLVSHPLVQNLSNLTKGSLTSRNLKNPHTKYLGLFIIYETIRKWVKVYHLTIKQIASKKITTIIDPKESYTIIIGNLEYISLFQEIELLLPRVSIELITNKEIEIFRASQDSSVLKPIKLSPKIIIISYSINVEYIKNLIDMLGTYKNTKIHQMIITCIECSTTGLNQLSEDTKYRDLSIYTTKITED